MAGQTAANFGPDLAVNHYVSKDIQMYGTSATDWNTLALIARVAASEQTDETREVLDNLCSSFEDTRFVAIAQSIINRDMTNTVAKRYIAWAKSIRRGANGSQAKRKKLVRRSEPVGA